MRLLIKCSGGALGSEDAKYDEGNVRSIADQIGALLAAGHQIGLVVGGGNLFRGRDLSGKLHIGRTTADYIGMLATVQNALVLRDYFESRKIETRVLSAIAMPQISESYIPRRALRHMEKGRVVIFCAGLGAPFFTTDSSAVQRALEIGAEMLVMAKEGVDGVYTADPRKDPSARKLTTLTLSEALERNLMFADAAAIGLAREHGLAIRVVGIADTAQCMDERLGTTVRPEANN